MRVPFGYLQRQFADPKPILDKIEQVVKEGDFTLGKRVEEFENAFAKFIGTKHAVAVGSGTDALILSLKTIPFQKRPVYEVITAANTFIATAGAIRMAGMKPVFVDCNDKYVIDADKIENAITDNTVAIMPVHYSGQPAEMDKILRIAQKHSLHVIEDACCAIDAEYRGERCGTFGSSAAFSLHPQKNLNVWGDGGMITTNNGLMAERLRLLRNHGMVDRDHYDFFAHNSRLDTLQAVIGSHLLPEVKNITNKRIEIANKYDLAFKDLGNYITIPERDPWERRVYHMYMLLVRSRDDLLKFMHSRDVEAKIHYPLPLHLQNASLGLGYTRGDFPVAEAQAQYIISLPCHQHLTDEEVQFTIDTVREFYDSDQY